MEKLSINQVILVEGKYDKIKLESFIDGTILTTDGFRIFKDREKRELIRALAQKHGLIVMTDSDVAGFRIRNLIRSVVKDIPITHVYIPQIKGKERRKTTPSKEGTLGVEGLNVTLLQALLEKQGVFSTPSQPNAKQITRMDFVKDGLSGSENSSKKRAWFLKQLELPPYLSTKALLQIINRLITFEEYKALIDELETSFHSN